METEYLGKNEFNRKPPTIMHIDINSCFAAIEQQANPKLRGIPTVVAAYKTDSGCVLTASVEAKRFGIKTGMRVRDAKNIYPGVKVLTPDPPKYRFVHSKIMEIFRSFTPDVYPKSIDEAVLIFDGVDFKKLHYLQAFSYSQQQKTPLTDIGLKIKELIKQEIGEWITVSVGISTNRFLAKTASSLKKPDGLEEINYQNIRKAFSTMKLEDICGINNALKTRLNLGGIFSCTQFLDAPLPTLKSIFKSVGAYHWYLRLRGWEIDDVQFSRKSIGHTYALPKPTNNEKELGNILLRLCEKVGSRLRNNSYVANGIWVSCLYKDNIGFSKSHKIEQPIFSTSDIFGHSLKILNYTGYRNLITNMAVSVFGLSKSLYQQEGLFSDIEKKKSVSKAEDEINGRFGDFTLTRASLIGMDKKILDRIAFGGIKDL